MTIAEARRRTARHEAGHLFAYWRAGYAADRMTVVALIDWGHVDVALGDVRLDRDSVEARLVGICAGEAAVRVFAYEWPEHGAEGDQLRALELARIVDRADPRSVVARCMTRAERLIRDNRAVVDRLAAGLIANHGRVGGGNETTLLLEAAINDTPTPLFFDDPEVHVDTSDPVARRLHFEALYAGEATPPSDARLDELWMDADRRTASGERAPSLSQTDRAARRRARSSAPRSAPTRRSGPSRRPAGSLAACQAPLELVTR